MLRKLKRQVKRFAAAGAAAGVASLACAGNASAAVDLLGFSVDTATPEALAAIILSGLGVMWGIRKLVKLINRS